MWKITTNHWRLFYKNLEFKFLKGEKLVIADTLSRAYVKITHTAENRLNILLVKIKVELQDSRLKEIISSILPAAFEFMKLLCRKEVQVYI